MKVRGRGWLLLLACPTVILRRRVAEADALIGARLGRPRCSASRPVRCGDHGPRTGIVAGTAGEHVEQAIDVAGVEMHVRPAGNGRAARDWGDFVKLADRRALPEGVRPGASRRRSRAGSEQPTASKSARVARHARCTICAMDSTSEAIERYQNGQRAFVEDPGEVCQRSLPAEAERVLLRIAARARSIARAGQLADLHASWDSVAIVPRRRSIEFTADQITREQYRRRRDRHRGVSHRLAAARRAY